MSLAIVKEVKSRKEWKCGRCREPIAVGDMNLIYKVGFRGHTQRRCLKPACTPARRELESSIVSEVYDVLDSVDVTAINSFDDALDAITEVSESCESVAAEYEGNVMYDANEALQERAEALNSAAAGLAQWDFETMPDETDFSDEKELSEARSKWLHELRDNVESFLGEVELP